MIRKPQFISLIRQGYFEELFVSELGWNRFRGQSQLPPITVDDRNYNIKAIAERNGFQVLYCEVDEIPTQSVARKIDTKLRRQAYDYICIYRLRNTSHDLWVVPVKATEKRDLVLVDYEDASKSDFLYSKIDGFSFDFDEETNIVDLRSKVQGTFAVNSEKITKDFYSGFRKEHKAFADFIIGIDDHVETRNNKNKQWYASVMLNRLMFCYFIQKKGFLNTDHDYLRHKLDWVRKEQGENRFFKTFYRGFLSNLFHDGLNSPEHDKEFVDAYGKIPYLNGGMFDEHQLEREYADIDIRDEAFIRLFDFFDKWRWHLDTRLTASGKDINPDVLGYIFAQYINDRAQMGAYYTKEDITEYIGRNCILPFLFDETKRSAKDEGGYFGADGYVWETLRRSGDKYIFDAVKKGYSDFNGIPDNIRRGIITEEMRKEYSELSVNDLPAGHIPLAELRADWNSRTPDPWGLPTEIWRETIERLQRCDDIIKKIGKGTITSINDFITYNLDIRSFAHDLIAEGDSRFVGRFYHALQNVTILDPTCGSGAFLFAAMNILEPLYEICIERMQELNAENPNLFKDELKEINNRYRSNIQYFIYKSIILRNLYGVDIMVEATEIAKLRLFLKMVAVVDVDRKAPNLGLDPLPDIDFNIRCGNTLVGYANKGELENALSSGHGSILIGQANEMLKASIETEMNVVASTFRQFKELQLNQEDNMVAFKEAKKSLRDRLAELNDKLNRRLYLGANSMYVAEEEDYSKTGHYQKWLKSHQPFHWLAEFYQIIEGNGGFDVIIGNPPYVVYNPSKIEYTIHNYESFISKNLYVYVLERSLFLSSTKQYIGFIVPLSFGSGKKNEIIRSLYQTKSALYVSSYEIRPAKLFDGMGGADQRLNIVLKISSDEERILTTQVLRWHNEYRRSLFKNIFYSNGLVHNTVWRFSEKLELDIFSKFQTNKILGNYFSNNGHNIVHYRSAGLRYWIIFSLSSFDTDSASNKEVRFSNKDYSHKAFCILSSNLYWWYYACNYDMFNQTVSNIEEFRCTIGDLILSEKLPNQLNQSQVDNRRLSVVTRSNGLVNRSYAYDKKQSKSIIDKIDMELAKHYGFTEEELDFIINYDIKYRMGDELNNSEE